MTGPWPCTRVQAGIEQSKGSVTGSLERWFAMQPRTHADRATGPSLRLFIAIDLPDGWTAALAQMQALLRRQGLEQLRWVRPEGVHLTLKFLGGVDAVRV